MHVEVHLQISFCTSWIAIAILHGSDDLLSRVFFAFFALFVVGLQRFTSAGGNRRWEKFVLPERVMLEELEIVAVEGPDIEDYPTLRVSDCQVLGKPYSPGSTWVSRASRVHNFAFFVDDAGTQHK